MTRAQQIVNTLTEADWQPEPPRMHCHHGWATVDVKDSPGMRIITQECPKCQKRRVVNRRILPKLPRVQKPYHKGAVPACRHIWGTDVTELSPDASERRYRQMCPKCGKERVIVRRILPPK